MKKSFLPKKFKHKRCRILYCTVPNLLQIEEKSLFYAKNGIITYFYDFGIVCVYVCNTVLKWFSKSAREYCMYIQFQSRDINLSSHLQELAIVAEVDSTTSTPNGHV